ncbi:MAG TPA: polysaccharide pyruvyl transferase family protein [Gammaproteobacteria bacterium]|nr:polysaccharide pyruvyl transferase family protein [Gammaproteobacteria bacterium]
MNNKIYSSENEGKGVKKRIGLITPYQGFNFGDGAIQDAMIHGLNKIDSSVECYGITLYPADTEHRHGILSIPITGLVVKNYSEPEMLFTQKLLPPQRSLDENQARQIEEEPPLTGWRKYVDMLRDVKNLPYLGSMLRFGVFRIRELQVVAVEVREIFHAYNFARNLDLLVLSGGGQLDEAHGGPWGHPYAIYRWSLIGRLTRTPFVVASNGSAIIRPGLTDWFLKKGLKSAVYRSYRDVGTRDQLSPWGFTKNDPIVRDLALGIDPAPYFSLEKKVNSQLVVAISPIYHSGPSYTTYDSFVEGISDLIQWLVERGDSVKLFRTTSIERLVLRDVWINLRQRFGEGINNKVKEIEAPCYQDLLKEIVVADLVVASRLHSIILSHVLNKPTLAISWDRKVEAHMKDLDQEQYMINIHSLNGNILKDKFEELERDSEKVKKSLESHISNFQSDLDQQYKTLLQIAGNYSPDDIKIN